MAPTLVICLSVIDGPMVLVEKPEAASTPVLSPWVRVVRQEVSQDRTSLVHYAVDVVHYAFLNQYVNRHLLPFADSFAEHTYQMREVLLRGGIAPGETWRWTDLKPAPSAKRNA
jgi:hypothetical protein